MLNRSVTKLFSTSWRASRCRSPLRESQKISKIWTADSCHQTFMWIETVEIWFKRYQLPTESSIRRWHSQKLTRLGFQWLWGSNRSSIMCFWGIKIRSEIEIRSPRRYKGSLWRWRIFINSMSSKTKAHKSWYHSLIWKQSATNMPVWL